MLANHFNCFVRIIVLVRFHVNTHTISRRNNNMTLITALLHWFLALVRRCQMRAQNGVTSGRFHRTFRQLYCRKVIDKLAQRHF
jgi:hypothetical protein